MLRSRGKGEKDLRDGKDGRTLSAVEQGEEWKREGRCDNSVPDNVKNNNIFIVPIVECIIQCCTKSLWCFIVLANLCTVNVRDWSCLEHL